MKRIVALLPTVIAICLSCNESVNSPRIDSNRLQGAWEIRYSAGGDPAYIVTNYQPGNGRLLVFSSDSCWSVVDSAVYGLGAYYVDNDGTKPSTQEHIKRLHFTENEATPFELRDDTLYTYPNPEEYYGYICKYIKIAEDTVLNQNP